MKATLRKLDIGITRTKIILEHNETDSQSGDEIVEQITALSILLGAYNEFGRNIPVEVYQEIRNKFNECIEEIKSLA